MQHGFPIIGGLVDDIQFDISPFLNKEKYVIIKSIK